MDNQTVRKMSKEQLDDLSGAIQDLKETVQKLDRIVAGDDRKEEPTGLRHLVYKNTQFRKVTVAWLWLLTGSVMTIGMQIFFNFMGT